MRSKAGQKQRERYVLPLKDRYQLYESDKKNPDPAMTYEAWVKHVAKKNNI